jgi:hypothetical protein
LPLWSIRTVTRILLGDVDLDPTAALGNHPATGQLAIGRPFLLLDKVDAGTAVQLADHHPLGTVDDELAAAHHDRQVAQIDLFLDRLLAIQPQPNPQRPAVGQPQLAALRGVTRLAQFVDEHSRKLSHPTRTEKGNSANLARIMLLHRLTRLLPSPTRRSDKKKNFFRADRTATQKKNFYQPAARFATLAHSQRTFRPQTRQKNLFCRLFFLQNFRFVCLLASLGHHGRDGGARRLNLPIALKACHTEVDAAFESSPVADAHATFPSVVI